MDSIPISAIPMSALVMLGVVILATVFAMRAGFSQLTAVTLALPMAAVTLPIISQTTGLTSLVEWITTSFGQAGLFVLLTIPSYIFMRLIVRDGYGTTGKPVQGFLVALSALMMIAVFRPLIPVLASVQLPSIMATVFGGGYTLYWFIASLALLGAAWRSTDTF